MPPTLEQLTAVLDAASRVLEARADRMLTCVEWGALAKAVAAARPGEDPPGGDDSNMVEPEDACPVCGERDADQLAWLDDERVRCQSCGKVYKPAPGGG